MNADEVYEIVKENYKNINTELVDIHRLLREFTRDTIIYREKKDLILNGLPCKLHADQIKKIYGLCIAIFIGMIAIFLK